MNRRLFLTSGSLAVLSAAAPAVAGVPRPSPRDLLATRAESSAYTQTSNYEDLQNFFAALDRRGAPIVLGVLGKSVEGRDIPYAIVSRPRVRTVAEARALGRAIVLVQAGAHGNHVDGKEAVLALVRDLCLSTEKTVLEDIVLVVIPSLNPDGNERSGPQPLDGDENGPARIGTRENAQGLDLDADLVKLEAPETRALVGFVRLWRPDVFIALQTSGKSFDEFNLTHAPSLHPAAFYGGVYARDRMLPEIHKELHEKFSMETFSAGTFGRARPLATPAPENDTYDYGWFAPDYRPRAATNYMGLRGPVALCALSYAHDTLVRRVFAAKAFVETALGYTSLHDDEITRVAATASHWLGGALPVRGAYPGEPTANASVSYENLAVSFRGREPGVPMGLRRTGDVSSAVMPIYDRYVGTTYVTQPKAYLVPYRYAALFKPLLDLHGVFYESAIETRKVRIVDYVADRIERAQVYEKHRPLVLAGHWRAPSSYVLKFGTVVIPTNQPLGPLVSVLLEPESDDGFFFWNVFDAGVRVGSAVPVMRML